MASESKKRQRGEDRRSPSGGDHPSTTHTSSLAYNPHPTANTSATRTSTRHHEYPASLPSQTDGPPPTEEARSGSTSGPSGGSARKPSKRKGPALGGGSKSRLHELKSGGSSQGDLSSEDGIWVPQLERDKMGFSRSAPFLPPMLARPPIRSSHPSLACSALISKQTLPASRSTGS